SALQCLGGDPRKGTSRRGPFSIVAKGLRSKPAFYFGWEVRRSGQTCQEGLALMRVGVRAPFPTVGVKAASGEAQPAASDLIQAPATPACGSAPWQIHGRRSRGKPARDC